MNAIPYNASKAGLIGLTIDLAVKWARHGIRVNAIAPGWFPTDMSAPVLAQSGDRLLGRIPLGRFGGPDDLKGAVVYLASAASAYVTGQTIAVDGGQTAS
jgi:gluconate 5-dehydrogenase